MNTIRIEAIDTVGQYRIDFARRRLKNWDGVTWCVTDLPVQSISRMHLRPATTAPVDWLCMWIDATDDPHVRVVS